MKRRWVLAVVLAVVLIVLLAGTALAVANVSITGVIFKGTFVFGGCTVNTVEYQVEHRFLGKFHLMSTNIGTATASLNPGAPSTACTVMVPLPPPNNPLSVDLIALGPLPFAAVDIFNPVQDQYVAKSFGLASIPNLLVPPPYPPMQVGVDAWRANEAGTLCGYAYLYGGNYAGTDQPQLVLPFSATVAPGGVHTIEPGKACAPAMPKP